MEKEIRYIRHQEIDKAKWDNLISRVPNGVIYAYSWYLDAMADHWDAVVMGDYEAVFPLPYRKKYGIYYICQPAFTAQLGVFGNDLTAGLLSRFIAAVPAKFRLMEVNMNAGNQLQVEPAVAVQRFNYVLPCNQDRESLWRGFRDNIRRNIRKAASYGLKYASGIPVQEVIELSRITMLDKTNAREQDFKRFENLVRGLLEKQQAAVVGVRNEQAQLLASAVFFFSHRRAYYILVGNHPNGKTLGASHFLIASFIEQHAGQDLLLDFEGSDIPSLAFFYSSFGAIRESYPALRIYRLPWWVRLFKR